MTEEKLRSEENVDLLHLLLSLRYIEHFSNIVQPYVECSTDACFFVFALMLRSRLRSEFFQNNKTTAGSDFQLNCQQMSVAFCFTSSAMIISKLVISSCCLFFPTGSNIQNIFYVMTISVLFLNLNKLIVELKQCPNIKQSKTWYKTMIKDQTSIIIIIVTISYYSFSD